jgi:exopolyphosphatase/guanosine-5'-triphosphate,3'-diphosphate pyrophosphatase
LSIRARRAERSGAFSGVIPERAIIDIGSNTVRMVIYGGTMRAPTVLLNEKVVARLGRDLSASNTLSEEAQELAMRGLKRFVLLLEELGVEDVETVATAAAREAENGKAFIKQVKELGLDPRVITGEEEARYSASGVLGAFPGAQGAVADLGGGSLELVRIADGLSGETSSLPLGTLRLPEFRKDKPSDMRKALGQELKEAGWRKPIDAPLYLVGGTWRAMAVYAMEARQYPLTDPHGFELSAKEAGKLAEELADTSPDDLRNIERISAMRAASLPDAALLLQAMLKKLEPARLVFSSWGLREGLLYDRLEGHEKSQDPLLAGVATFAAQRGAPPTLATRIAGWTAGAVPQSKYSSERLRVAATMLALASMQIEPNIRHPQAWDWALHKRWIALSSQGRAMLAAAIAANGNRCEPTEDMRALASNKALEEAICWGLATRLARRIGARSQRSFQVSRLGIDDGTLVLTLADSHRDLFGIPNEKDMKLLADRLGLGWDVQIVDDDALLDANDGLPESSAEAAE